ncbi:hypothetical protein HN51_002853, partial [Arachis hypogaea]
KQPLKPSSPQSSPSGLRTQLYRNHSGKKKKRKVKQERKSGVEQKGRLRRRIHLERCGSGGFERHSFETA